MRTIRLDPIITEVCAIRNECAARFDYTQKRYSGTSGTYRMLPTADMFVISLAVRQST